MILFMGKLFLILLPRVKVCYKMKTFSFVCYNFCRLGTYIQLLGDRANYLTKKSRHFFTNTVAFRLDRTIGVEYCNILMHSPCLDLLLFLALMSRISRISLKILVTEIFIFFELTISSAPT